VGPPPPHILRLQAEAGPREACRPHRRAPHRLHVVHRRGLRPEPNPSLPHRCTTTTVSPHHREAARRAPWTPTDTRTTVTAAPSRPLCPQPLHCCGHPGRGDRGRPACTSWNGHASIHAGLGQPVRPTVALWPAAHRRPPVPQRQWSSAGISLMARESFSNFGFF
jgi:hypothetical protein